MFYHTHFNTFYKLNRKEIDSFLWATVYKYRHIMEPDDLFQDIVLKLLKSTVLSDWKRKESALNTYLTQRIRGYALHIITAKLRELYQNNSNEDFKEKFIFIRLDKLHEATEKDTGDSNKSYQIEIRVEPAEEQDIFFKEIMSLFHDKVNELHKKIYQLHYGQGFTFHEIVSILEEAYNKKFSYSYVRSNCIRATEIMLRLLSAEGVHFEK